LHNRYGQLPTAFYSKVDPTPLRNVHWVAWNKQLASFLSLPESANDELLVSLSVQALPSQFKPLAMKYAGHQFGVYNPELGDGRGLLL
ncbi:protein adenylyltransferase SelO family protein, partial [Vibrio aestuarianus]|uniref:protein adenylyltransferase SelO family protein n=1 Tax=Vibrio aestuarianus TaxID=28171 RepID=UPI0021C4585D